jgi:hypothetical protein
MQSHPLVKKEYDQVGYDRIFIKTIYPPTNKRSLKTKDIVSSILSTEAEYRLSQNPGYQISKIEFIRKVNLAAEYQIVLRDKNAPDLKALPKLA